MPVLGHATHLRSFRTKHTRSTKVFQISPSLRLSETSKQSAKSRWRMLSRMDKTPCIRSLSNLLVRLKSAEQSFSGCLRRYFSWQTSMPWAPASRGINVHRTLRKIPLLFPWPNNSSGIKLPLLSLVACETPEHNRTLKSLSWRLSIAKEIKVTNATLRAPGWLKQRASASSMWFQAATWTAL